MRHAPTLLALWLMLPLVAVAQTATLAPSQALQCLTPTEPERAALAYPPDALKRKDGGVVRAEMRFDHPELEPDVTILGEPLEALAGAVRAHLRRYRVPCLGVDQHTTLLQEFRFNPTDGRQVMWTAPRDRGDAARDARLRCVTRSPAPDYPAMAAREQQQGTVVVRATFSDGQNAPQVRVLDDTPDRALIEAALRAARQMRMPCHSGVTESVDVHYVFMIDGGDRVVVRDMPLINYLSSLKDIRHAQVYFDFNEMKCPFDVRILMQQPVANNQVGEVGESVPERAFFLAWLSRQRLVLPAKQQNRLIGQSFDVSVPCGALNLGRAAGGGASQ
jgi:TonB family protein